jgi:hypothetical protein
MMTTVELEGKGIRAGDRIYVQYASGIVRSGVCLGLQRLPMDRSREDCASPMTAKYASTGSSDYIDQVEITIPKDVLRVCSGRFCEERAGAGVE